MQLGRLFAAAQLRWLRRQQLESCQRARAQCRCRCKLAGIQSTSVLHSGVEKGQQCNKYCITGNLTFLRSGHKQHVSPTHKICISLDQLASFDRIAEATASQCAALMHIRCLSSYPLDPTVVRKQPLSMWWCHWGSFLIAHSWFFSFLIAVCCPGDQQHLRVASNSV